MKVRQQSANVAFCTMVTNGYTDLVKTWVKYNIFTGVKHLYIYDNAPYEKTQLHYDLQDYVEMGYVTIVPWYKETWQGFMFHSDVWPKHQIWSQNDCIQRYGYKYEWLGIFDIDEFLISLPHGVTFIETLQRVPSHYCSVVLYNCFSMSKQKFNSSLMNDPSKLLAFLEQDVVNATACDGRIKHFIRPSKVYYFRIHWLESTVNCFGSYSANKSNELRLNHYKENYQKTI